MSNGIGRVWACCGGDRISFHLQTRAARSTIDGLVSLSGVNARIADAGTLATNSALAGLNTIAGI